MEKKKDNLLNFDSNLMVDIAVNPKRIDLSQSLSISNKQKQKFIKIIRDYQDKLIEFKQLVEKHGDKASSVSVYAQNLGLIHQQVECLSQEISNIKNEIRDEEKTELEYRQQIKRSNKNIVNLEKEKNEIQKRLNKISDKYHKARADYKKNQEEQEYLEEKINRYRDEVKNIDIQIIDLKNDEREQEIAFEESQQKYNKYVQSLESKKNDQIQLELSIKKLRDDLSSLSEIYVQAKDENEKYDIRVATLTGDYKALVVKKDSIAFAIKQENEKIQFFLKEQAQIQKRRKSLFEYCKSLETQNDVLREKTSKLEDEKNVLMREYHSYLERKENLQVENANNETELRTVEDRIVQITEKKEDIINRFNEQSSKKQKLVFLLKEKKQECEKLEQSYLKLTGNATVLDQALEQKKVELNEIDQQIDSLTLNLINKQTNCEKIECELQQSVDKKESLQNDFVEMQQNLVQIDNEEESLILELKDANEQVKIITNELDVLHTQIKHKNVIVEEKKRSVNEVKKDLNEHSTKLQEQTRVFADLIHAHSSLETKLFSHIQELELIKETKDKLESKNIHLSSQIEIKKISIKEKNNLIESHQLEMDNLKTKMKVLHEKNQKLCSELEHTSLSELASELMSLKDDYILQQKKFEELTQEVASKNEAKSALNTEIDSLDKLKQQLAVEIKKLEKENQNLDSQTTILSGESDNIAIEVEELQNQRDLLQRNLDMHAKHEHQLMKQNYDLKDEMEALAYLNAQLREQVEKKSNQLKKFDEERGELESQVKKLKSDCIYNERDLENTLIRENELRTEVSNVKKEKKRLGNRIVLGHAAQGLYELVKDYFSDNNSMIELFVNREYKGSPALMVKISKLEESIESIKYKGIPFLKEIKEQFSDLQCKVESKVSRDIVQELYIYLLEQDIRPSQSEHRLL